MKSVYTDFQCGCLAFLTNILFYFFAGLFYHLFDAGRMDSSVYDQFFQSNSCHLTADRIERGKNDCFRCIVDDQVNACHGFECTDVSSFTADDAAFHFIARKLYHGDGTLGYVIDSTFLNSCYHILFCLTACFLFCSALQLFVELCCVDFYFVFHRF